MSCEFKRKFCSSHQISSKPLVTDATWMKNSVSATSGWRCIQCASTAVKMHFWMNCILPYLLPHEWISSNISLSKTLWSMNSSWLCFVSFKDNQFSEDELFWWQSKKVEYVEQIGTQHFCPVLLFIKTWLPILKKA